MLKIEEHNISKNVKVNQRIAEHQDEYLTLHANIDYGVVSFACKLRFRDLLKVIFNRKIYISILTFGQSLQPISVNVDEKDFEDNREYNIMMMKEQVEKAKENAKDHNQECECGCSCEEVC